MAVAPSPDPACSAQRDAEDLADTEGDSAGTEDDRDLARSCARDRPLGIAPHHRADTSGRGDTDGQRADTRSRSRAECPWDERSKCADEERQQ